MNPGYKYEFGANGSTWPNLEEDETWSIIFYPLQNFPAPNMYTSLQQCVKQTAKDIYNDALSRGQNIRLHLSGGDDSKIMVQTFRDLKIPFQLTTRAHYMQGRCVNQADVDAAQDFCAKYRLQTDLHVIDDLDLRWGDTDHRFFLDMTALSARLGWERYKDEFNVLATTPYFLTSDKHSDWTLLPTFSMSPNFLHSFFLHDSNIFFAQLNHKLMKATQHARSVLKHVANSMQGAERWRHLADVFAYEQIVKPMIVRNEFPWLQYEGRPKNTGFDTAPLDMNTEQPAINERYRQLLKKKVFRIPLAVISDLMTNYDCPTRVWCSDRGELQFEELPVTYK